MGSPTPPARRFAKLFNRLCRHLFTLPATATGREIRNSVEAATEQAAITQLLNRNMLVVSINEKIGKKGRTGGGKVALAVAVIFTRQLSTMIDAGLAMVQSLQALAEQTNNKVMRDIIKDVTTRVEGGDSFSDALPSIPRFSTDFIAPWSAPVKRAVCSRRSFIAWRPIWKTPPGCRQS